jgi:hypothetical protein
MNISKKQLYYMYQKGISVKELAKQISKSTSSVYKYISEVYTELRFPILKQEIKNALFYKDFPKFLEGLSYKDICLICRKFNLYKPNTKKGKLKSIERYFHSYSILGLYPENLSKEIVKKAYFKRSKELHPDMNKSTDTTKEFIILNQIYQKIMNEVI